MAATNCERNDAANVASDFHLLGQMAQCKQENMWQRFCHCFIISFTVAKFITGSRTTGINQDIVQQVLVTETAIDAVILLEAVSYNTSAVIRRSGQWLAATKSLLIACSIKGSNCTAHLPNLKEFFSADISRPLRSFGTADV
ncbi:unnamed protein product [Lymnaea stagnalis]|uniref:Uncharacterized protein n=1 Tax=Lymnaea stagnalis TaxID=6523 RepID=A0AAV2H6C8_LYMST